MTMNLHDPPKYKPFMEEKHDYNITHLSKSKIDILAQDLKIIQNQW